tara:strand:- start:355 stop:1794 length:1440 start_codon:yes stop_codon:yes gene_type:complete
MNKKGATQLLILFTLVAGTITILGAMGYLDIASLIGSGNYIERPVFYYDKCEAVSDYDYTEPLTLATNGQWLNKPSVSSSYDVKLKVDDLPFSLGGVNFEYYVCNSKVLNSLNCRTPSNADEGGMEIPISYEGQEVIISNVRNNEYVWVQFQKSYSGFDKTASSGGSYQIGFVPYGIRQYNVISGSPNQINPNSCTYPSNQMDTLLSTNADKINSAYRGVDMGTSERVLQPEEVRWYVAGYLTSASPSFVVDGNKWCRPTGNTGELYAINEVTTLGGTYKIASADWSDYIKSVNCCPQQTRGDEVCDDNFEWKKIRGNECGVFQSCGSPNWIPYDEGEIVKYNCVSGKCEKAIKQVECSSDYDCIDSNQICDLNSWICEDANVNLKGQIIITIPDNQRDCEGKGGVWITQETASKTGLFCFGGLGKCQEEIIIKEYCEMESTNWALWIGLGVVIIILFFFRGQIFAIIKTGLGKVGVKI